MALDVYESRLGTPTSRESVLTGIVFYLLETATVFLVIHLMKIKKSTITYKLKLTVSDNTPFYVVFLCGIGVSVAAFIVLPELRTQYYSIFTNDRCTKY